MRVLTRITAGGVLTALALTGCAPMRQDPKCKYGVPILAAALGAAGGGLGVSEVEPTPSKGEIAAGSAAGLVVGSLVGLVAGHYLCEEATTPPPPPPPLPPAAAAPPAKGTRIANIPGPNFEFNKASLTAEGKSRVREAAALLKQHPTLRVSVEGHTDSIGGDAYNMRLSERRAQTVADVLADEGISKSRLDVRGFGKTRPIADNKTAAGRAENRRVEIIAE